MKGQTLVYAQPQLTETEETGALLTLDYCHSSGPVVYLAQVTHLAGKFHLHCCLFALLLPCCISGTSHTSCREVPSALLPVCSAVSPAYKNSSYSPSFFSSSFLFSFLVFRLVHQSKSQVSSQVRSRLLDQLGLSSTLPLPRHNYNITAINKEEVPESAQKNMIQQHHDRPLHRYPG